MFSVTEKLTIEKYFIKLKIEKAKELIQAKELNFTEISQHLDYSNMNYLSRQFKNETGLNMSAYKDLNKNFRISLDFGKKICRQTVLDGYFHVEFYAFSVSDTFRTF